MLLFMRGNAMKQAYKNMRSFWLDIKNLENRNGVIEVGVDKIAVAGVEMAMMDGAVLKHLFLATNSLGDSSLYFENNSASGVGGVIGGHGNEALQNAAAHMLAHASKLTDKMQVLPTGEDLPSPSSAAQVRLFAVSKEKLFHIELNEADVRQRENPFFPFFAYSQQVLGFFRTQQMQASDAAGRA